MNSYRKIDMTPRQEKREKGHRGLGFGLGLVEPPIALFLVGKFLALYIIVNMVQGCSNLDKQDKLVINAESCERFSIEYIEAAEGYKVDGPPIGPTL